MSLFTPQESRRQMNRVQRTQRRRERLSRTAQDRPCGLDHFGSIKQSVYSFSSHSDLVIAEVFQQSKTIKGTEAFNLYQGGDDSAFNGRPFRESIRLAEDDSQ